MHDGRVLSESEGHNSHGEGILVVAVADVSTSIAGIRATVHQALSIVDITITASTAGVARAGWVSEIDEDQAGATARVSWHSADSNGVVLLFVDHNVMG